MQQIAIEKIHPHPDNPRLIFREDVISGIVEQLKKTETFDPAYALLVRPVEGGYQILQGHHRLEAAKQAGLSEVPCWIREMDDDEAYMQLVLGNVQGELDSIEIGMHTLGLELDVGGRGKIGGLAEYARQIGKHAQKIGRYRKGAVVLKRIQENHNLKVMVFLGKAEHLAAIHGAPEKVWQLLADWIFEDKKKDKSANQVQELVKKINKLDIPERWEIVFLPLDAVVRTLLASGAPMPYQVKELVNIADSIISIIRAHCEKLDTSIFTYTTEEFCEWLRGGIGTYAWQVSSLEAYRQEVISQANEAQKPSKPDVKTGEWYRLGSHLLYCGDTGAKGFWEKVPLVPFAFADPPYNAEVAEWDVDFQWSHDWLTDKAEIVTVTPGIASIQDFFAKQTKMPYRWSMAAWIDNGMTRGKLGFGNWIYLALFSREESIHRQAQDFIKCSIRQMERENIKAGGPYKGKKPDELLEKLMGLFTEKGDTVIDPFLGSGTTLLIAEDLGRHCIGGEIQPEMCNSIIEAWQEKTGQQAERIQIETNAI